VQTAKSLGSAAMDLRNIQLVLPNDFLIPLQNKQNQGEVQLRLKFMPEFLSNNKRKSGFGGTFIGSGVGMVASGGHMLGHAGVSGVGAVAGGVGAVAGGVGAVGQGAFDVTGTVGKGAIKGVGSVGKGVGAVGKGVFSAGASALGLGRNKDKSDSRTSLDSPAGLEPSLPAAMQPGTSVPDPNLYQHGVRPSNSDGSLNVAPPPVPRTSVGSIRSRSSVVFDHGDMIGEPGNLTLHVIEADTLMGVDKSGTSDPYVKVNFGSKTVLKTKVKKENLSPNWSESVVIPGLTGHPVTINFCVRDHNTIGSDKDLGEFDLRLWEYIQPASEAHPGEYKADFWVPLGGSGGRLHLALDFEPAHDAPGSEGSRKKGLFGRK